MNWTSWGDFFSMGGYAFYVWGSYVVTFAAICAEIALLASRRRGALARVVRRAAQGNG